MMFRKASFALFLAVSLLAVWGETTTSGTQQSSSPKITHLAPTNRTTTDPSTETQNTNGTEASTEPAKNNSETSLPNSHVTQITSSPTVAPSNGKTSVPSSQVTQSGRTVSPVTEATKNGTAAPTKTIATPSDSKTNKNEPTVPPGSQSTPNDTTVPPGKEATQNGNTVPTVTQPTQKSTTVPPSQTTQKGSTVAPSQTSQKGSTVAPSQTSQKGSTVVTSQATQNGSTVAPSQTSQKGSTVAPSQTSQKGSTVVTSQATQNGSTVAPSQTSQKGSTVAPSQTSQKGSTVVTSQATQKGSTVAPSQTSQKGSTVVPSQTTQKVSTVAPSQTSQKGSTVAPSQTSQKGSTATPSKTTPHVSNTTPAQSTGNLPVTSSGPTVHDKVYINEIMVNKQGVFQKVELSIASSVDISHYAMVIVDGSTSNFSRFNLETKAKQEKSGYFTINVNASLLVVKELGTGIAIYDTNEMTQLDQPNWTVSSLGLIDALVIAKTYSISQQLLEALTPESSPFVLDPNIYGAQKTISRCSSDSVKSTDMFIMTDSSLGDTNNNTCTDKMNSQTVLVLKFDGDCQTMNDSTVTEIMKYVVRQVNKNCQCGITRLHVRSTQVSCCDSTLLKIKFVIPSNAEDRHLATSYKQFVQATQSFQLDKKTYQLDQKCYYDYKSCCDQYKSCCEQPEPKKQSDAGRNVKITVATVIACILVFLIIVVIVIVYMKRKKTVNYQFRMSRLREDDDDLMMDNTDVDDFVGGQEATFDMMKS